MSREVARDHMDAANVDALRAQVAAVKALEAKWQLRRTTHWGDAAGVAIYGGCIADVRAALESGLG
jgi:hypothetical protein